MLRWILFSIFFLLLTFYGFQAIRTITKSPWAYYLFIGIAFLVVGNFIIQFAFGAEGRVLSPKKSYAFGFLLTFMSFNLVLIPFLFGEDIFRFIVGMYHKLSGPNQVYHAPSRRKFVSGIALGLAAIPFASMLYGMYQGKYNFKVLKHKLHFADLPEAFDGYRIVHISDIHSGSFDDYEKIEYAVNLVKEQKGDVILFTGDLVNNKTIEMIPWKSLFSELKAEDGVFSVLGNHDYGDYIDWDSQEEKARNLEDLKFLQREMGYDLLLNESRYLERGGERIALVGVENWGKGGFKKVGDLKKASENIQKDDFKILMSHDPSHWDEVVLKDDWHYHLTLSGHTHGMQFGIEIPGWIKWSPIKYRYKHWAGVYHINNKYINVNRGFGYLGYPGRVGIWPEITVIELKRASKSVIS